jgi:hypothetical protein
VRGLNPKFVMQDGERILIDVRRAALWGATAMSTKIDLYAIMEA